MNFLKNCLKEEKLEESLLSIKSILLANIYRFISILMKTSCKGAKQIQRSRRKESVSLEFPIFLTVFQ